MLIDHFDTSNNEKIFQGYAIALVSSKYKNANGIIIDYYLDNFLQLEFFWKRQDSKLNLKEPFGVNNFLFNVAVEYFQAGLLYDFEGGKVAPFGGITIGATKFIPKANNLTNETIFALTLVGGAKYFISEHFGFRLQGQLLFPVVSGV